MEGMSDVERRLNAPILRQVLEESPDAMSVIGSRFS